MSSIGKQPVPVPSGVDVTIEGQNVSVKGPKGTLDLKLAEPITDLSKGTLTVSVKDRQGNVSRVERTFSVRKPAKE